MVLSPIQAHLFHLQILLSLSHGTELYPARRCSRVQPQFMDPTLEQLVPAATCQLVPGQPCPELAVTIQDLAILVLVRPHPTMSPFLLTQTLNKIGGVTDSVCS